MTKDLLDDTLRGGVGNNDPLADRDRNVDDKKVDETVKMIEELLNEKKPTEGGDEGGDEATRKRKHDVGVGGSSVSDEEKRLFFKEKNIQVNLSTLDVDDADKLAKKPKKKKLKNEMTNTDKELKSISTQTPRNVATFLFLLI